MAPVPTLAEVRRQLSGYSAESIIAGLGRESSLEPFIVSRLVHEAALASGAMPIASDQLRAVASRVMNVADPELTTRAGTDLTDGVMARLLPQQLIGKSAFLADIHRALEVLAPDVEAGPLGRAGWRDLLGMELTDLIVGVMCLSGLVGSDGTIVTCGLTDWPESVGDIVTRSIDLLTADTAGLRRVVSTDESRLGIDVIRGLGPLVSFPIVRLTDDRLVVPSRAHLESTLSAAGLYIRLARADGAARTRERTEAAGSLFEGYLQSIAAECLPGGWIVVDLDEGAEPEEPRADFLLVPPDGRFVLVVESKTTLQALTSLLRPWDDRKLAGDLYQGAFDQIDASSRNLGADGVAVFGLVVTLDRHITTRLNGRTYVGVPIFAAAPTTPSAASRTPARVVSAQDFEDLIEALAGDPADPVAYLAAIYEDGSAMNATEKIRAELPEHGGVDSLSDRLRVEALRRLAASSGDPAIRTVLERASQ